MQGDGKAPSASVETDLDMEEREDVDDLPPIPDAELEAAERKLAEVFREAMKVDIRQPLTNAHEAVVAKALVDVTSMAMEEPALAAKLPTVRFIQMNPCQPVRVERAFELLRSFVDAGTFQSVSAMFASPSSRSKPTHGAPPKPS